MVTIHTGRRRGRGIFNDSLHLSVTPFFTGKNYNLHWLNYSLDIINIVDPEIMNF